ncbi:MAG: phosphoribosylformylglycinamidine synthase [Vallitalea sp.]|jgi:phosphoribosylformylglycinamidine synthase|nr:phosphoribosylformylglycinamidine synthase [Vallitalea sp.]
MNQIRRVFVEKIEGCNTEAKQLLENLRNNLFINNLIKVKVVNRYDISNITEEAYKNALYTILSEPQVDNLYQESYIVNNDEITFAIEYLPGQYDQRADWATQCIKILNADVKPVVRVAKVIILKGKLTVEEINKIKKYCINPVDSREAILEKPDTLELEYNIPTSVSVIDNFINMNDDEVIKLWKQLGLAMSQEDLLFTKEYFKNIENRNPSITEIRVLDTYWSDHCRHTTFLTAIKNVTIEEGKFNQPVEKTYKRYLEDRENVLGDKAKEKDICLMDIALLAMKKLRLDGKLDDLEVSEEINACSIVVNVDIDGKDEEWLVMFKNETHNHPTEIEPFGGAATCLGGAIRDPLSGRSYVYQAMRVTGSADPRTPLDKTLPGKLSQRKITTESSHGYSSYGNQIGLATGMVKEIYHPNYVAKHMEIGAVIAATPRENVIRETSDEGDIIVLLGGRTGRDGCGGATGSSKKHTEESIHTCGAEVQKGNPPTERKIQRLFRNKKVSTLIKKCNDFGAGGVSVAIGELADGLVIDLDKVPKKYEGLDGTELAISESQERMAVVIDKNNVDEFISYANEENLEAVVVAHVTEEKRLVMKWNNEIIVNISREFLDTNGATAYTDIVVNSPCDKDNYFVKAEVNVPMKKRWLDIIGDINICSQKGLVEKFDSSIGASSVFMPYGGKYQLTPTETMVAKIPLLNGDTSTGTIMSYGYNPYLMSWSPYHGAVYSIVESIAKIVATGGDYSNIRFTFQEYFKRLGKDESRWGEPFSALLGAYLVQDELELPSIGGKDSMSGTFNDIDVPPTLVSFAVNIVDVNKVISPEFKQADSHLIYIPLPRDEFELPQFDILKKNYTKIHELISEGNVLSAHTIGYGGLVEAISKMAIGNKIGAELNNTLKDDLLYSKDYGSILIEVDSSFNYEKYLEGYEHIHIGTTINEEVIKYREEIIEIDNIIKVWENTLEDVYPTKTNEKQDIIDSEYNTKNIIICKNKIAKPKVFIPVFPGTNCEYDTAKVFEQAGANVDMFVFKNLTSRDIKDSIKEMTRRIEQSQIVMIPGGFSAGDEPEGSGKLIATVFRNEYIKDAINKLLNNRDGLMLGICNGFQSLIKLGLVPYGEIKELTSDAPTLTYNTLGRHISCIANTKIVSNKSPWLSNVNVGDIHAIPVSHGEGRFIVNEEIAKKLFENGQVATQYVDFNGNPSMDTRYNPNGSLYAIEGITSPDGKILGKMGHSERIGSNVAKNIVGTKDQMIFKSGVEYFTK